MRTARLNIAVIGLIPLYYGAMFHPAAAQGLAGREERVVIESRGWQLVGDLRRPDAEGPYPVVLMLNQAAGNRKAYAELARQLAVRGVASLRLDLPGHGESVNLGRFVPGETTAAGRDSMIRTSDLDVAAAHRYLRSLAGMDPERTGIVGASYSGQEMAQAGRDGGYARAYVALSPGSFSDESIDAMDPSGAAWLFIVAKEDQYLTEIAAAVHTRTSTVEVITLPGSVHATHILEEHPEMSERIAVWLERKLQ